MEREACSITQLPIQLKKKERSNMSVISWEDSMFRLCTNVSWLARFSDFDTKYFIDEDCENIFLQCFYIEDRFS